MTADTGRNGHILVCNSNTYTDILVCVHSRSTNTDISFIVIQIKEIVMYVMYTYKEIERK